MIDRVRAFLPDLRASNEELKRKVAVDPTSVDIENVDPSQEKVIQMVRSFIDR